MVHLLRMEVGNLSQRNGKGRQDEPILECYILVAAEATEEAGDKSFTAGPTYVPLNLTSPTLARKKGFLLRCCPAQSIFSGFFQDLRVSRKILTRDRRMGTAIGRKSGM